MASSESFSSCSEMTSDSCRIESYSVFRSTREPVGGASRCGLGGCAVIRMERTREDKCYSKDESEERHVIVKPHLLWCW